jgi:2-keto-myo-inositol isomerase
MLPFALNHMTAPGLGWQAFADLARDLGCIGVEFRNDLAGPLFQGADPASVGAVVRARGLRFLALAEVKMFNDWSDAKAAEAEALMKIAVAAGAEAVSLIPRNDGVATDRADSRRVTELALREILPMLRAHGLKAMVEPLGFAVCSLRYKDVLADVIDAVGGQGTCFIVHDTFHHHLAGGGPIFADLTGIIHVSGVVDAAVAVDDMRDPHRVLVDAADRLGNVAQIGALRDAGYGGPISYEPFAPSVHALTDARAALATSMDFIRQGVSARAA